MAQKSIKGTQAFQDTIRTYLDKMAESDALFAVKYANPSKSLSECITYIICQVQKSGCNGFEDDFYGISSVLLFKRLLSDTRIQTLLKSGDVLFASFFGPESKGLDKGKPRNYLIVRGLSR